MILVFSSVKKSLISRYTKARTGALALVQALLFYIKSCRSDISERFMSLSLILDQLLMRSPMRLDQNRIHMSGCDGFVRLSTRLN